MTTKVPYDQIESLVGMRRQVVDHYAKARSDTEQVYILHSHECLASYPDLRDCPYSLALDEGIDPMDWDEDIPVRVEIEDGLLFPVAR